MKNIIKPSNSDQGEIISPIFIRPKKESGKVRLIFNLKHLNDAVTYRKFKMDTLDAAIRLMTPGCFMTSIALRDAIQCSYQTGTWKYLKFVWRGVLYHFTSLPWVSKVARVFLQKFLSQFFATLRSQYGYPCYGYI